MKKNVYHMACNKWDTQIAVVENVGEFHSVQESSVRLYDVGRIRDTEDDAVSLFIIIITYVFIRFLWGKKTNLKIN